MDGVLITGLAIGIPAFTAMGGTLIYLGQIKQKVNAICEWQPKCDMKLDDTAERVARIEGVLNGDRFPR